MGICYIVGAAEGFVPFLRTPHDLVIAADGGYRTLLLHGITPDLVVGDFDSSTEPEGVPTVRHPVRKDDTDTALAFDIGFERGYRDFVLLCAMGGREDHTFANYCLLNRAKMQGADMRLRAPGVEVRILFNEQITLCGTVGDTVSLFPFGGAAVGVTLTGLSYPLTGATLPLGCALGVSNSLCETQATVSVEHGALLLFHRTDTPV